MSKTRQKKYWYVVDNILRTTDIIIEVLDSRFPNQTKNTILAFKIKQYGRKHIILLNKSDLVPKKYLYKHYNELKEIALTIPFSCKERRGKLKLKKLILTLMKKRPLNVGVVGYPNVGKSSVINYLKGRKSAKTSTTAGFTKGQQWIRMSKDILLIDTPGVIPFKENNRVKLILKSAITNVKDPESTAADILELLAQSHKTDLEKFYKVKVSKSGYLTLERIAESKKLLKKGGILDLQRAGLLIIQDWQKNRIKIYK